MPRVVVLGSSNTDMNVRLPQLPRPGETRLGGAFAMGPGGKGANQAVAARRAGAEVRFVAAVGDDSLGQQALQHYQQEGLKTEYVRTVSGTPSGVALIFIAEDGENLIGVAPGANAALTSRDIDLLPDSVFDPSAVLLVSLEVPLHVVARMVERASTRGMKVILNPAPAEPIASAMDFPWSAVTVLTPNRTEAETMLGRAIQTATDLADAGPCFFDRGVGQVIITLGSSGCWVATRDEARHLPPYRVRAVDTVAAGDAFNGVLAVMLAEGFSLFDAAGVANAAAALAVTRPGAQESLPRWEEIDRLLMMGNLDRSVPMLDNDASR
jgi:ribokinase